MHGTRGSHATVSARHEFPHVDGDGDCIGARDDVAGGDEAVDNHLHYASEQNHHQGDKDLAEVGPYGPQLKGDGLQKLREGREGREGVEVTRRGGREGGREGGRGGRGENGGREDGEECARGTIVYMYLKILVELHFSSMHSN